MIRRLFCILNGHHNAGAVTIPLSPRFTGKEHIAVRRCESCGSWSVRRV